VAVSDAVADGLRGQGIPEERVIRIYNGVNPKSLRHNLRSGVIRKELGIAETSPLLGCIGQIAIRKGQDLFLDMAECLLKTQPDAHFLLAGARYSNKAESRDYESRLRERSKEPPLKGRVHVLGYRADAASLINDLTVVVVPSRQEPLSRVLLEALALGTPTVATGVGGTPEIIEHEKSGLIVPPGDPEALAGAATRLLQSRSYRQKIKENGTIRALDFDAGRQAGVLAALYDHLGTGS
jgi:glycosyltransferase involved in cell wall biosynthesis